MRKFKIVVLLFTLLLFPLSISALEPMPVKEPGDLHITVFITDSPDFIKEWVGTPQSHGPTVRRIKEAKYNQMVHAGFAVTGLMKDSDSKVNFIVAIQVETPDGNILLQDNQWATHTNKVTIDKGVIIANPVLDMTIETSDPSGNYIITAIVVDKLSGKRATGSEILKIQ